VSFWILYIYLYFTISVANNYNNYTIQHNETKSIDRLVRSNKHQMSQCLDEFRDAQYNYITI